MQGGKGMLQNKEILYWTNKIKTSGMPVLEFFKKHNVPFEKTQYYAYLKLISIDSNAVLSARTKNKKLTREAEEFIVAYLNLSENLNLSNLQYLVSERYECKMSISGLSKAILRLTNKNIIRKVGRPKKENKTIEYNQLGGFELITAVAFYLEWPERISSLILRRINKFKKTNKFKFSDKNIDKKFKNKSGHFTKKYNQRKDVRKSKFISVDDKRETKNWKSMNIFQDSLESLIRKNMALLSLPVITLNGSIRNINAATGQSLSNFCGYNYKQSSINKYLSELKYLGISTSLLEELPLLWSEYWKNEKQIKTESLICFYIDGNTKGLWSSKRVKQNKVTMLGRVMGCLEQLFIHDGHGHPIYFETYSGHAPTGEHVLEMFDKIKNVVIDIPRSSTNVYRAIVMDGANNSAKTLISFASQNKYHYITPLDDNQFTERMIVKRSPSRRYRDGEASLHDLEIDLRDSTDKTKIVRTRAVEIDWDNGKKTVLMTSLPVNIIDSSIVVWSYFRRWPCQEIQFKKDKATVSLSKIAGYGKKEISNERVQALRLKLESEISILGKELHNPFIEIDLLNGQRNRLIKNEISLKAGSKVKDGRLILNKTFRSKAVEISSQISSINRKIKVIEKNNETNLNKFRKKQKEWLRLEKKEKVYSVDVELDQIMTFFRVSLAGFFTYFVKNILNEPSMDINQFIHRIIHLQAKIETIGNIRKVSFIRNRQDKKTMDILEKAIIKMNKLKIVGPHRKLIKFEIIDRPE